MAPVKYIQAHLLVASVAARSVVVVDSLFIVALIVCVSFVWTLICYALISLEAIELEYSLRLKIKRNDWQLADTCPQTANHCAIL